MSLKQEEIKEIPIIYPLISVTLRTVAPVNGRVVDNECEEILNMDLLTPEQAAAAVVLLLSDFEEYVSKVVETASSPAAQQELQHILDNHVRPAPRLIVDPPLSQGTITGQGADTEPSNLVAALPTASL